MIECLLHQHDWQTFLIDKVEITFFLPCPVCDETANKVITPRLILPGTASISIQKETHEMATIKMEGK